MSSNSHSSVCSTAEETDEDEEATTEPFEVQPFDTLLSGTSRYLIMEFTGEGSFGQVARALNLIVSQEVALKILKTESESEREIRMLEALSVLDPVKHSVVHFCEKFQDRGHTCLVFEKLDMDLLGLFKQQQWAPLTPNEIRPITYQLLTALGALKSLGVVHADLKPDNIMLVNHLMEPFRVKLIDFGLSFMVSEEDTLGKIIQPQGYRAPEVSLGLPVSQAIDVWGLGCVLLFLFLVQHPFSTTCEYQEMKDIVDLLGQPADDLLHAGYFTQRFFKENRFWHVPEWWMKTPLEYQRTTGVEPEESKSPVRLLDDLLTLYPWMQGSTELEDTRAFVSLLKCLLHTDPEMRISPERALLHPFITMVHLSPRTDGLYFKDTVDKMRTLGLGDSYNDLYTDEDEDEDDFLDISVTPRSTETGSEVQDDKTEEESGDEEHSATPRSTDEEEESATPNTTAASDDFCSAAGELTADNDSEQTLSPTQKNRLTRIREVFDQESTQRRKVAQVGPDGVRLKDWHGYDAIRRDAARVGDGEQGKPFPLTDADRVDQAYRENGFNIYVSDRISLNRSVPDIRHAACRQKLYAEKLPNTSVIIPFHNEGWSSLLRTVHSIFNRSPPQLIAEVILVDDFSDKEHLKAPLDHYMSRVPKVQILRTRKREGLIRTRLLGAAAARGQVITFLDSHCEANVNWLPPLLDRISQNRKTIVCPMIDVIDHDNFGYETQAGDAMRGAFDWEMYYKRIPIPSELMKVDHSEPFESPVMAGGLFAVDRKWFWELGGYDTGLEIWGGEQYEISFKVWMCGGRMEDIPCSRVGHIYRKYVPYKVPGGISLAKNLKRVAEVWMDEYAEYVYQRRPEYRHLSAGDMTAQKELRSRLNCKNFKWFMSKVAWDLPKHYPPVEPPAGAWGEIRHVGSGMCMEIRHFVSGSPIRLESCVKGRGELGWSHGQVLTFGWREDIRVGDPMHTRKLCFDAISHNSPVTLYDCHGMKGNQLWRYRKDQSLYHPVSNSCVDSSASERRVFMNTCDPASGSQRWMFERTNATVLENFNQDNN